MIYKIGRIIGRGGSDESCIKKFQKCLFNNLDLPLGSKYRQICLKATFIKFWNEKHKNIKIGSSNKDACSTCWEYETLVVSLLQSKVIKMKVIILMIRIISMILNTLQLEKRGESEMEDKSQNFVLELLLPMVPSDRVASNDNNIDGSVSFYVETQSRGCNDGKVV